MLDSIPEKTGKTLPEWAALIQQQKLEKHGAIMKFLKGEHGLTHGYANLISLKVRGTDAGSHDPDDLVDAQYSKGKEHLRPIYERILSIVQGFGGDVEVAPKKSAVSLRRARQFALVQPSTKTRIDLGLKYSEAPVSERMLGSGSFGTMCTNRVVLTSLDEVDEELIAWLREAYEQAGK